MHLCMGGESNQLFANASRLYPHLSEGRAYKAVEKLRRMMPPSCMLGHIDAKRSLSPFAQPRRNDR